jgi:hypothetical protein
MGKKLDTETHNGTIDGLNKTLIIDIPTNKNEQNIFIQTRVLSGTDSYTSTVEYRMIGTDYFKAFESNTISNTDSIGIEVNIPCDQIQISSVLTNTDTILEYDVYVKGLIDG